jgi:predicted DNA-binding ribbon-helix-helix protein
MCHIYASTDAQRYESTTRSLRLRGFVTSVRLENEFWEVLARMAQEEQKTAAQFISQLYDEVVAQKGEVTNLASMLRVACAVYLSQNGAAAGWPSVVALASPPLAS